MDLKCISVIPLEFLTDKHRAEIEEVLTSKGLIISASSLEYNFLQEICSAYTSYYVVSNSFLKINMVFIESSCCIVIEKIKEGWGITPEKVVEELRERQEWHRNIISGELIDPIRDIYNEIAKNPYYNNSVSSVNYVFSFYIIEKERLPYKENHLLMYLVEPSFLDLDDMISAEEKDNREGWININHEFEKYVKDYDISVFSNTYITWATLVSVIKKEPVKGKTEALIVALVLRQQSVWNKCYTLGKYVDNVIEENVSVKEADEVYWSFFKTVNDVSTILTSTLSTRANKLFDGMVETSSLRTEVKELKSKFELLEKYILKKNEARHKRYTVIVELLLFLTALASIGQLVFPLPMLDNDYIGWIIIFTVMVIGIVGIINSKR